MRARITIQDINSSHLKDITKDSLLYAVYGGAPTTDTSFAYDVAWVVGTSAKGWVLIGREVASWF